MSILTAFCLVSSAFCLFNPQSEIRIPQSKDNGGMKFQGLHAAVRRRRRPATTPRFP
jgi:hypothetical protein